MGLVQDLKMNDFHENEESSDLLPWMKELMEEDIRAFDKIKERKSAIFKDLLLLEKSKSHSRSMEERRKIGENINKIETFCENSSVKLKKLAEENDVNNVTLTSGTGSARANKEKVDDHELLKEKYEKLQERMNIMERTLNRNSADRPTEYKAAIIYMDLPRGTTDFMNNLVGYWKMMTSPTGHVNFALSSFYVILAQVEHHFYVETVVYLDGKVITRKWRPDKVTREGTRACVQDWKLRVFGNDGNDVFRIYEAPMHLAIYDREF